MAYVVRRPKGRWEIRESTATDVGPRSRTLASFGILDAEAIEVARTRATRPFDTDQLLANASRAGAPVEARRIDALVRQLLRELADDERPARGLRAELRAALEPGAHRPEAASWVGAPAEERGAALMQLLAVANAFPGEWKPGPLLMPQLRGR